LGKKESKENKVIHIKHWPGGDRPSKGLLAGLNLIENPDDLHDYLKTSMGPLNREEFRVLYLNRSRHLISEEVLFKGTVDIPILDHVVIGRNSFLSMKRHHPDIFEGISIICLSPFLYYQFGQLERAPEKLCGLYAD